MSQLRVCQYFHSRCQHPKRTPTTFFDLPQELRYRIYEGSGVPRIVVFALDHCGNVVNLLPVGAFATKPSDPDTPPDFNTPPHSNIPRGLETYRQIRCASSDALQDVTSFVCDKGQILLCCHQEYGLSFLLDAPLHLWRSLKYVTIYMRKIEQENFRCLLHHIDRAVCMHGKVAEPLKADSKRMLLIQRTWNKIVRKLKQLSEPASDLNLVVVADVQDAAAAQAISEPMAHLELQTCTVRFANKCDPEPEELARHTVVLATKADKHSHDSFRYHDLPLELQIRILTFSELVAPRKEIHWYKSRGYWVQDERGVCRGSGDLSTLSCSVHPRCECWRPPTALFLVSRAMLLLVNMTFFSTNRFVIEDPPCCDDDNVVPRVSRSAAVMAAQLLYMVARVNALRYLRDIQIVFSDDLDPIGNLGLNVQQCWSDMLALIGPHLRRLTLRLYLNYNLPGLPLNADGNDEDYDFASSWTLDDCEGQILDLHRAFVRPLTQIQDLRRFFVYSTEPWCWPSLGPGGEKFKQVLLAHAESLEQQVMGVGYDSTLRGKWSDAVSACLGRPEPGWIEE